LVLQLHAKAYVMRGKNRYSRRSHLSEAKFRWIVPYFAHDLPASKIAELSDVSRPTINQLLFKLRTLIAQLCDASSPFSGEVEVDESSFGGRRVHGKKGRGAGGKTIVFGILERHGKVYTEIVPNAARKSLQAESGAAWPSIASSTRTAGGAYDGLVDRGYKKHFRVNHGQHEFVRGNALSMALNHFGHMPNVRLAKFNGVPRKTFHLHLKECEFRFNPREENFYDGMLSSAERKSSLKLSRPYFWGVPNFCHRVTGLPKMIKCRQNLPLCRGTEPGGKDDAHWCGNLFTFFDTFRQYAKGKGLGLCNSFFPGLAVFHCAGNFEHLGSPLSIRFPFCFDRKLYVLPHRVSLTRTVGLVRPGPHRQGL